MSWVHLFVSYVCSTVLTLSPIMVSLVRLDVFNTELSPDRYWWGQRSREVGKRETVFNAPLSPPE